MSLSSAQELRLLNIIQGPCLTEKAERISQHQQLVLEVARPAKKLSIKQAVELLFKVKVARVRTVNVKGKVKHFKQIEGKRKDWKKAYVSLEPGHTVDLSQNK
jgi:large subunit ribosomal protein L23